MKPSVELILLVALFSAPFTTAQGEDDYDDAESTSFDGINDQNENKRTGIKRAGRVAPAFDVDIANYPYVAFIEFIEGESSGNGAIISDTHVLTEAALANDINADQVTVFVGDNNQASGTTFKVKTIQRHPKYNATTLANNVAILTINGTFKGVPNVKPIGIRTSAIDYAANCFIVGWQIYFGSRFFGLLGRLDYQLATEQQCAANISPVPSSIQCASAEKIDGYFEGGGAPLICNNRLYGIHSKTLGDTFTNATIDPFTKLSAAIIQEFLFSIVPRPNYLWCPCTKC